MSRPASLGIILDHTQDTIVLLDEYGEITYANQAVEHVLGWEPAAFVGQNAFDHVHPDDVDAVSEAFEDTIASTEFTQRTERYRHQTSDGSWVWLESRMSNLTDDKLDGYIVSSRDITDRITAQREYQDTADRLQEIAGATHDVLWMFDSDWSELLFINPAYETVFGQSTERLERDPTAFLDAVHPDDVSAVTEAMKCLSTGNSVDIEYRVNPGRNYNVWVWVQAEPIVNDESEVVRITGFVRDITDRSRRERQLCVMDNLLRHNLRNDMTTILGQAEIIEQQAPDVRDRVAVIRRTGEKMLETADKEREIIDVLTAKTMPQEFDVPTAVSRAVDIVQDRYPDTRIDVETPDELCACALRQLELAVIELIENAIRYSDRDSTAVRVAVESNAADAVITISDSGPPMPEIGVRVLTGEHDMNDLYHSTGLGLWLVYWILELSDGSITVRTDDEAGNRITLCVPRVRE